MFPKFLTPWCSIVAPCGITSCWVMLCSIVMAKFSLLPVLGLVLCGPINEYISMWIYVARSRMCKVISPGLFLTTSSGFGGTLSDSVSITWTTITIKHDIPKHRHIGSVTSWASRHHKYLVLGAGTSKNCRGHLQPSALDRVTRCWPVYTNTTPIQISMLITSKLEGGLMHDVSS